MSLGSAVVDIVANTSKFEGSTKRGVESAVPSAVAAATNLGKKTGDRISSMISKSVKVGAATFTAVLGTALVKGFQRLDAIDQARKKMEALGHSTKTVDTIMGNALASVKGTAFGLGDAAGLAATLVASGIKPGMALESTLKRVADSATVAGVGLGDMGMIWGKAAAKGRIDGELVNQLIERQIPIYDILGKAMGKNAGEIAKMVSQGKVSFADFSDAMNAYVGGAALKSGETFRGALANMGAALGRLGAKMLEGVFPQLKGVFGDVTGMLDSLAPVAERVGARLGAAFTTAYAAVQQFVSGLTLADPASIGAPLEGLVAVGYRVREAFVAVWDRLSPIFTGITSLGLPGLTGLAGVIGLVSAKAGTLLPFISGLASSFPKLGGAVKFLLGPLGLVAGLFVTAYTTSAPFREAVNTLLSALGTLAGTLLAQLAPVLGELAQSLFPVLLDVVDALAPVLVSVVNAALPLATSVLPLILSAVLPIVTQFGNLIDILAPFATEITVLVAAWWSYTKVSGVIKAGLIAEKAAWIANKVAAIASMGETMALRAMYAADAVKRAAMVAGSWVVMGTQAMLQGARMAAAWLLAMGPVGWVIAGLVLLGAGLVALWNKSETFRNIVLGAWEAIKAGVAAVVSFFTDTVWPGIQAVWNGIVSGLQTAWGFISGVFNAIVGFISGIFMPILRTYLAIWEFIFKAIVILVMAAWKLGIKPVFDFIVSGLQALGNFFMGLYNNYVKPAFNAVGAILSAVWNATIKVVLTAVQTALGWLGDKFTWLRDKVVIPVWNGIKSAIKAAADWVNNSVFTPFKAAIGWVGDRFTWIRDKVIVPVWNGIKSAISGVVDFITGTVFGGLKTALGFLADRFEISKNNIARIWEGLKEIAKAPIKFVIDTVLNKGLIKGFNWLSEKIGGPKIANIPLPFKEGGVLPGYSPGRDIHRFYSATGGTLDMSGGEGILIPQATRGVGGPRGIAALNDYFRHHSSFARGGVYGAHQAFAGGGVFGWIKSKAAGAFDWVRNKAGAIWEAVSDPGKFLLSKIPALDTVKTIAKYGEAAVLKTKDSLVERVRSLWSSFTGAFDKTEAERVAAEAAAGGTAGVLPPGARGLSLRPGVRLDQDTISRLVQAAKTTALRVIQGSWQNYHLSGGTHLGAGAADIHAGNWGSAVAALRRSGMLAMFRNWPGNQHIHALNPNIGGLSSAARGQVATARRNNGIFAKGGVLPLRSYDNGGLIPTGLSLAHNGTGRPEPAGHGLGGGGPVTVYMNVSVDDLDKMSKVGDFLDMLASSRVNARRTTRSGLVSA